MNNKYLVIIILVIILLIGSFAYISQNNTEENNISKKMSNVSNMNKNEDMNNTTKTILNSQNNNASNKPHINSNYKNDHNKNNSTVLKTITGKEAIKIAHSSIHVDEGLELGNKAYKWPGKAWKINVHNKTIGEIVDFYIINKHGFII